MVSIKRNRHKNEVMNKSVCFSAVILSTFLLFVSCKDNRRTSYISNRQENKETSCSLIQVYSRKHFKNPAVRIIFIHDKNKTNASIHALLIANSHNSPCNDYDFTR